MQRITLKAVAKAAGVHPSTVSLALRNQARIPAATRKRIAAIALKMGYQPDPFLAALNAYRINLTAPQRAVATLGWLVFRDDDIPWQSVGFVSRYYEGARQRARELGFALDTVVADSSAVGQARAARVLKARGIRGLMLPPVSHGSVFKEFPWDQFSTVSFGYSLAKPNLTRVTFDHVSGMTHMLMAMAQLGYRKIGLHMTTDSDATERTRQVQIPRVLEGAYLSEHARLFGPPPPVFYESGIPSGEKFRQWIKEHQVDALILHGVHAMQDIQNSGIAIPGRLGVALCMRDPEDETFAGIDQNDHGVGRQAVDALDGLLRHNILGEPDECVRILVSGCWRTGKSVRCMGGNRPRLKDKPTRRRALSKRPT